MFRGFGRTDQFTPVSGKTNQWDGQGGRLERAVWMPDASPATTGTMMVRRPNGTRLFFHGDDDGSGTTVGHLTEIRSRNGNSITIVYEDAMTEPVLLDRRIEMIFDSFGRELTFAYTDSSHPQQITLIVDFSGRFVQYEYDSAGDLVSVVGTPVGDHGISGSGFSSGKERTYTYRGLSSTPLEHALTSITYPNEVATSGPARLSWTYNEGTDTPLYFVKTHTVGSGSVGGTYEYAYTSISVSSAPGTNTPVVSTEVTDRRGVVTTVEVNYLGQMLNESIADQSLRTSAPTGPYVRSFEYTADGLLLSETKPLGNKVEYTYPSSSTWPRLSLANQLTKTLTKDGTRPADQTTIVYETAFEPVFNRKLEVDHPCSCGANATYTYDYMEDLSGAISALASGMGLTTSELTNYLTTAGITTSTGDVNGDSSTSQYHGNVVKLVHPTTTMPSEASLIGLGGSQSAVELFRYNEFGQRLAHVDAEENVHEWVYFGANDPDGDGLNTLGGSTTTGGYLKEHRVDTTSSSGRNSGTNPTVVNAVTKFSYLSASSFPKNLRGVPVKITGPCGIETHRLVNELDQVVKEVRAAAVPSSGPYSGLTAFGYETITRYDANDNVISIEVEDAGNPSGTSGSIKTSWSYDILDHVTSEVRDVGGLALTTTYGYDESMNLTSEVRGSGTADASTTTWSYDERDIVFTTTRGAGASEVSTTATKVDKNGNVVARVDAESQAGTKTTSSTLAGDQELYEYDGFDRLRKTTDREGLETTRTYDEASNVVMEVEHGDITHPGFSVTVDLEKTEWTYDERNRQVRQDRHLYHHSGLSAGTLDDGDLDPGDDLVSMANPPSCARGRPRGPSRTRAGSRWPSGARRSRRHDRPSAVDRISVRRSRGHAGPRPRSLAAPARDRPPA